MRSPGARSLKLSAAHTRVLLAIAGGCSLKAHRYLDGTKVFKLHPLDGPAETVQATTVDYLLEHHLIDSNKKFPAATYWLTETGREHIVALKESAHKPSL